MIARALILGLLVGVAGCATRADLLQQDRRFRALLQDQRRQLEAVQREVERLRADIDERGGGRASAAEQERVAGLQQRIDELERERGTPRTDGPPEAGAPPTETAATPPARPGIETPPPPAGTATPPPPSDEWRREVAAEQAQAASAAGGAEYAAALEGVARKDCARAVPQLNGFAATHKDSPLAGNAVYWAGRCYAATGKSEDAISKFYEVGTKYAKGDKAAAALWAQGSLFLKMGNTPDARLVFSKLIREYPKSDEAARARQKISEID